jgi:hypothetical protein
MAARKRKSKLSKRVRSASKRRIFDPVTISAVLALFILLVTFFVGSKWISSVEQQIVVSHFSMIVVLPVVVIVAIVIVVILLVVVF